MQEKSCGAVVFLKNNPVLFLLLHYSAGHWDFVKGNVESNESEKETVIRELEEETGIVDANLLKNFRERVEYFYRRHGTTVHKEVIFYLLGTNTEKIDLSHEHVGYIWLDFKKALSKLTFENARNVLRKAQDRLCSFGINDSPTADSA